MLWFTRKEAPQTVEERKASLRAWLDSDPSLRPAIIEGEPKLKALVRHVERLERLVVGFRREVP